MGTSLTKNGGGATLAIPVCPKMGWANPVNSISEVDPLFATSLVLLENGTFEANARFLPGSLPFGYKLLMDKGNFQPFVENVGVNTDGWLDYSSTQSGMLYVFATYVNLQAAWTGVPLYFRWVIIEQATGKEVGALRCTLTRRINGLTYDVVYAAWGEQDPTTQCALAHPVILTPEEVLIEYYYGSGGKGAWYNATSFVNESTDAAGVTPVTAVADSVGRLLDLSGNGHHFTQADAGRKSTVGVDGNGVNYLHFDSSDDSLVSEVYGAGGLPAVGDCFMVLQRNAAVTFLASLDAPGGGSFIGLGVNGNATPPHNASGAPAYYVNGVAVPGSPTTRGDLYAAFPVGVPVVLEIRNADFSTWASHAIGLSYPGYTADMNIYAAVYCDSDAENRDALRSYLAGLANITL